MKFENIGDIRDFHLAIEEINSYIVPKYKRKTANYNSSQEFINEAIQTFQKHEIETLAIKLSANTEGLNGFQIEINPTSQKARDFLIQYDLWRNFLQRNEKAAWFGYKNKYMAANSASFRTWESRIVGETVKKMSQFPEPKTGYANEDAMLTTYRNQFKQGE